MSSKTRNLRVFASSRETKKEGARPSLVPKLRFPKFRGESHAKARSREEEGGGMAAAVEVDERNGITAVWLAESKDEVPQLLQKCLVGA
jgi:hypothetical protein